MCQKTCLSKAEAINAISVIRVLRRKKGSKKRNERRFYWCGECEAFHLTSMKKQDYVKTRRII